MFSGVCSNFVFLLFRNLAWRKVYVELRMLAANYVDSKYIHSTCGV